VGVFLVIERRSPSAPPCIGECCRGAASANLWVRVL